MRAFSIFFLCTMVAQATPASYERTIVKKMTERYDFASLTVFLKQCVQQHPVFEGISLRNTRVGSKWIFERIDPPRRMRNGDWVIWDQKDEDEAFDLYYESDANHVVMLHAKRIAKDKFAFLGISIDEWVSFR